MAGKFTIGPSLRFIVLVLIAIVGLVVIAGWIWLMMQGSWEGA